jgi:hypothetical protein
VAPRLLEGFLGAALLLAAIAKTADLEETGASLARLGLWPALARPVVAAEALAALALILGVAPAAATTAAVVLGVAFVAAHLRAKSSAGCGCLGALDRSLPAGVGLARAAIFLAAALAAWALRVASGTLGLGWRPTDLLVAGAGVALAITALLVTSSILVHLRRLPLHA